MGNQPKTKTFHFLKPLQALTLLDSSTHTNMQHDDKKMKVKKGWLAVRVGLDGGDDGGFQKFVIPIAFLYHPLFKKLLERAHEVYGYHTAGPLRLPCSVDDFLHLRWRIEKESAAGHHHHHNHHQLSASLSFRSC